MYHGQMIISVWNCRAVVSRYERAKDWFRVQEADNWQELEADALAEVETQDGARTEFGHYGCSEHLAHRAIFDEDGEPQR